MNIETNKIDQNRNKDKQKPVQGSVAIDSAIKVEEKTNSQKIARKNKPYKKKQGGTIGAGQNSRGQKNNKDNMLSNNIYSAIDLGTNNCRLLIAQQTESGFKVIDSFSRVVRLGEGLGVNANLSKEAIDRTIEALDICVAKIKRRGVTHSRNVATQACREAENCEDFIERVEKEVRIKLQIISPAEEARLAVMGCKALLDKKFSHAIVFDIGGGSTELIWVKINNNGMPEIIDWTSIPFGVVNLSEKYGTQETMSERHYAEMKQMIFNKIKRFEQKNNTQVITKEGKVQLLGTSGTITTLTAMHLELEIYDRNRVDGMWVKSSRIRELCKTLSVLNYEERVSLKTIGADRADLVVAGCAILESIMDLWSIDQIRVADRGIREGMLLEMMTIEKNRNKNRNRRRNKNRNKRKPKANVSDGRKGGVSDL
ncbi:MAG: Ppx/GppA family phosphatase [Emcibacter sp.]|nr:Ppx/GppA family phosphatase [Emcibacter sp.]